MIGVIPSSAENQQVTPFFGADLCLLASCFRSRFFGASAFLLFVVSVLGRGGGICVCVCVCALKITCSFKL